MELVEKIKQELLPLIESKDCYLEDIVFEQDKGEWYLRVYIDLNEGSLDMDTCVAVTELVSDRLDEIDVINQEYYLEVSSPGLERELKTLDAIKRQIGQYIYVELRNPIKGGLQDTYATLENVDEEGNISIDYLVKNIHKHASFSYDDVKLIRMAVKF